MSFIETERLIVRKWQLPRDIDDAHAIYGDPETMHYIPCGALSREATERLVRRFIDKDEQNGFGIWPVVLKENQRVIGECGLAHIPQYGSDIEMAWIFNRVYHGRGYATEAARATMGWAFGELGLPRVYALIDRENKASIRVANHLHMEYDRIIRAYNRDLMRYETRSA